MSFYFNLPVGMRRTRGLALAIVLQLLMVLVIVTFAFMCNSNNNLVFLVRQHRDMQAFYAAEAGLHAAECQLAEAMSGLTGTTLGGGNPLDLSNPGSPLAQYYSASPTSFIGQGNPKTLYDANHKALAEYTVTIQQHQGGNITVPGFVPAPGQTVASLSYDVMATGYVPNFDNPLVTRTVGQTITVGMKETSVLAFAYATRTKTEFMAMNDASGNMEPQQAIYNGLLGGNNSLQNSYGGGATFNPPPVERGADGSLIAPPNTASYNGFADFLNPPYVTSPNMFPPGTQNPNVGGSGSGEIIEGGNPINNASLLQFQTGLKFPNMNDMSMYRAMANGTLSCTNPQNPTATTLSFTGSLPNAANPQENVVLYGTPTNPIRISGPVYIQGNVVISGTITGQGAIYAGGNIYIAGGDGCKPDASGNARYGLTYKNPPATSPPAGPGATEAAVSNWVQQNQNADMLLLASAKNITVDSPTMPDFLDGTAQPLSWIWDYQFVTSATDAVPNPQGVYEMTHDLHEDAGMDQLWSTGDSGENDNNWTVVTQDASHPTNYVTRTLPVVNGTVDTSGLLVVPGLAEDTNGDGAYNAAMNDVAHYQQYMGFNDSAGNPIAFSAATFANHPGMSYDNFFSPPTAPNTMASLQAKTTSISWPTEVDAFMLAGQSFGGNLANDFTNPDPNTWTHNFVIFGGLVTSNDLSVTTLNGGNNTAQITTHDERFSPYYLNQAGLNFAGQFGQPGLVGAVKLSNYWIDSNGP
jgi:hypothetical protein